MRSWVWLLLLCTVFWGIFGLLAKLGSISQSPSLMQVLFTIGMTPLAVAAFLKNNGRLYTDRRGALYGIANGVLSGLGGMAYFAAMGTQKAVLVCPVTALYPLFTVLLAIGFLKEKLNLVQVGGLAMALISAILVSIPS